MRRSKEEILEARFEDIVRKEVINYDNLMELEDMDFITSIEALGDRVIVNKGEDQFILKMESGYLK